MAFLPYRVPCGPRKHFNSFDIKKIGDIGIQAKLVNAVHIGGHSLFI